MGRSDEELVARVRAGDDSAFRGIYDRYAPGVLAFCGHMLGSRVEAEDALQVTFVAAYRALRAGDSGIALRPWLYTIARNRCLSELRARPRAVDVDGSVLERLGRDGPADQVQRREELSELLEEIQRLPHDQRAALVLFELGDHSHREIAAVLGVRREKVKALIFQAREALVRGRQARDSPCAEIRELLATVQGKVLARSMTRAHIDRCPACAAFEHEVRRQRAALALILPVGLVGEVKASVLGAALSGGSGGIGAAAASGTAAGGAGSTGALAAGTGAAGSIASAGAGSTGAVAAGGLASAGTGACGVGVTSGAPAAAVATGLTAGGGELAVVGGVAGVSSTAIVTKIATVVAIATAVVGASHAPGLLPKPIVPIISGSPATRGAPAASAVSNLGAGVPNSAGASGTTATDASPNPATPKTAASTAAGAASPMTGASTSTSGTSPVTDASTGATGATPTAGASPGATGASPTTGASTGGVPTSSTTGASTGGVPTSSATGASTGEVPTSSATGASLGTSSQTVGGSAGAAAASPTTSNAAAGTQTMTNAQPGQTDPAAGAPATGAATQAGDEIAFVQTSSLPPGAKQSLTDKLTAANAALAASNDKDAKNNLDAALRYIAAQSGKSIPTSTATQLTADITRIEALIG